MTMEKREHLEETIISVLKTLSDVEDITLDNKIDDLGLDSIRWIRLTHPWADMSTGDTYGSNI